MKNKSHYLLILLTIIIISFPSICFSELKTVEGNHCDIYLGDLKNKKELDVFRKDVRKKSIIDGIVRADKDFYSKYGITDECFSHFISNYLEKVVIVSHSEKGRKICDKVKITTDTEVCEKYFSQKICKSPLLDLLEEHWSIRNDVINVLNMKKDKINIGLIIETRISGIDEYLREQLVNGEEESFYDEFRLSDFRREKYNVVDRRHLKTIIDEQKLSSSGLTDSETVKLGKLLNLDVIVLRFIYSYSTVTKVLKVDTGEVLLFKTYQSLTWLYK